MKLKSITIKNFKGIDEEGVTIDFAPITLLFGPNNAGKSTIIQALHLAREVFCEPKPDFDKIAIYGKGLNLGSFKDYVHKHDITRTIKVKLSFEDVLLPSSSKFLGIYDEEHIPAIDDITSTIKEMAIEFALAWNYELHKSSISEFSYFFNNKLFTSISVKSINEGQNTIYKCSPCSPAPFIESSAQLDNLIEKMWKVTEQNDYENEYLDLEDKLKGFLPQILLDTTSFEDFLISIGAPVIGVNDEAPIAVTQIKGETPIWGGFTPFDFQPSFFENSYEIQHGIEHEVLFTLLLSSTGERVKHFLNLLLYIGPMREVPSRGTFRAQKATHERWADGLAAWDLLLEAKKEELESFNKKLEKLGLPYNLEMHKIRNETYDPKLTQAVLATFKNNEFIEFLQDFTSEEGVDPDKEEAMGEKLITQLHKDKSLLLEALIVNAQRNKESRIYLKHNTTETLTEPHDMGLGVSQIIPFIAAMEFAQKNAFIAIEQPELHIHPKLQVNLGDVIIESALQSENHPLFLIETHSEHLLLRLLRRIRNTSEGTAPDNLKLTPEDIAVNWIGPTSPDDFESESTRQTYAMRLELDADGSFNMPWPEGFFGERREELYG